MRNLLKLIALYGTFRHMKIHVLISCCSMDAWMCFVFIWDFIDLTVTCTNLTIPEHWGESPVQHIRVHSVWLQIYQSIFWRSRRRQIFIPPDTIPLSAWPWTSHLFFSLHLPVMQHNPLPKDLWHCLSSLLRCENCFLAHPLIRQSYVSVN